MGNVLIVDDESTGKIILKQLISNLRNDINVITLSSGTEGLKWLSENKVDLIITDYSMPEMNGVEFIQKIRSLVDCEFVPIIMITVVSDLTVRHQALKSGATAFLKRPIDEIECETTCNNLLKLQEQNQVINDKADWLARSINIATQQIEFREKSTLQHIGYISSYRIQGEPSNFTRLSKLVYLIASGMGLTERECRDLEYSSPLHDAGMINLPDNIIHNNGAQIAGVVVAIDRQEKGEDTLSATQEITKKYSIPVFSLINLEDIIHYLETKNDFNNKLELIKNYQKSYGII